MSTAACKRDESIGCYRGARLVHCPGIRLRGFPPVVDHEPAKSLVNIFQRL